MLIMIGWPSQCASRYAVTARRADLVRRLALRFDDDRRLRVERRHLPGGDRHDDHGRRAPRAARQQPDAGPRQRGRGRDERHVVADAHRVSLEVRVQRHRRARDERERQNHRRTPAAFRRLLRPPVAFASFRRKEERERRSQSPTRPRSRAAPGPTAAPALPTPASTRATDSPARDSRRRRTRSR